MVACEHCGCEEFHDVDGAIFCNRCEAVSQVGFTQEADQFEVMGAKKIYDKPKSGKKREKDKPGEDGGDQASGSRKKRGSRTRLASRLLARRRPLAATFDGRRLEVEDFQNRVEPLQDLLHLLQDNGAVQDKDQVWKDSFGLTRHAIYINKGVSAMTEIIGMPPEFRVHVIHIWRCYLAHLNVETLTPEEPSTIREAFLSHRVVVAVLYLAALDCGYTSVTISDIARWMRDGHFSVPSFCHHHVMTSTVKQYRNYPLDEYFRVVSYVGQALQLPRSPTKVPLFEIACRFAFDMNLPKNISRAVYVLSEKLNLRPSIQPGYFAQQGTLQQGFLPARRSPLEHAFGRIFTIKELIAEMFISDEVKVMALILLVLKLKFRLDDKTEFTQTEFDFPRWLLQLKMRVALWKGYEPSNVVRKGVTFTDSCSDPYRKLSYFHSVPKTEVEDVDDDAETKDVFADKELRNHQNPYVRGKLHFEHLVPRHWPLFRTDIPTLEGNDHPPRTYDKVSSSTPLVNTIRDLNREALHSDPAADPDLVDTLFADFQKNNEQFPSSAAEMFPSLRSYTMYQQPEVAPYSFLRVTDDGIGEFFLSTPNVAQLYDSANHDFSRSFAELLSIFALRIGEQPMVLYATLVLMEVRLFDSKSLIEWKSTIETDGSELQLKYHFNKGAPVDVWLTRDRSAGRDYGMRVTGRVIWPCTKNRRRRRNDSDDESIAEVMVEADEIVKIEKIEKIEEEEVDGEDSIDDEAAPQARPRNRARTILRKNGLSRFPNGSFSFKAVWRMLALKYLD